MFRRSRSDLYDVLAVVLDLAVPTSGPHHTVDALAAAAGVEPDFARRMIEAGLVRALRPGGLRSHWDADDARGLAIAARLAGLGFDDDAIAAFETHMFTHCPDCARDPCPTRCDTVGWLRAELERLRTAPGASSEIEALVAAIDDLL